MLAFPLGSLLFSMDPVLRFLSGENLIACACGSSRPLQALVWTWGGLDEGEAGSQLRGIPRGTTDTHYHLLMFSLSQAKTLRG